MPHSAEPEVQEAESPLGRPCACGCGTDLTGRRTNVRYHSPAHKTAAWKARNEYVDQRARKPSPRRNTSGPSGLQVSFPKAVRTIATNLNIDPAQAEAALTQALPEKQRQRLHDRSVA